jgi:hypothetical protein
MGRSLPIRFSFLALAFTAALAARAAAQTTNGPSSSARVPASAPLGDLERALLEGLPPPAQVRAPAPLAPTANKKSDSASGDQNTSPLADIARQMRSVQGRLAERDVSPPTQAQQQQIVAELKALLENSSANSAAAASRANTGKSSSQAGVGTGDAQVATTDPGASRIERGAASPAESSASRVWGHLPESVRQELAATPADQFVPKYRPLIEAYYKRLAEESRPRP